ncbi:MAG: DUF2064 domain-containing protein, partial [Verrucomicrobiia bacterium]
ARMAQAVAQALAADANAVVLLGGDCPELLRQELLDAVEPLERADAVIAPATDGGYVLLALKRVQPELFEGIVWSTSTVFETTLERARACGLRVELTRAFTDVDDWASFQRAGFRGMGLASGGPPTA